MVTARLSDTRWVALALLSLIAAPSPARAQAAADGFRGTPGTTLSGQGGGTGWAGNWSGGTAILAAGGSVQLSAPGGQFLGQSRRLAFRLGRANTTEWISFRIRRTRFAPAGSPPAYGGVALGAAASPAPSLFIGDTGSGRWSLDTSGPPALLGVVNARRIITGVPAFLVVRADFRPSGDTFTLYQDPAPGLARPNVVGVVKTDLELKAADEVTLTAGNGNAYAFGPLRLGTSYRAVAPHR